MRTLHQKISRLIKDREVTNKRGIFEYVLSGGELTPVLHVRYFKDAVKRTVYDRQTQAAKLAGVSNCPMCAAGGGPNSRKIWERKDMDFCLRVLRGEEDPGYWWTK